MFLDAEADVDDEWMKSAEYQNGNATSYDKSSVKVAKKLTNDEIVAQCFVFLLAGFDTTANSLAYVSYCLAMNSRVQQKLQLEIDEICIDEVFFSEFIFAQYSYLITLGNQLRADTTTQISRNGRERIVTNVSIRCIVSYYFD